MLKGAAATLASGSLVAALKVEDSMASTQSEVMALLESWSDAARTKDIDRHTGSSAVRGNFLRWFDMYEGPIGLTIRDVNILASGDSAVAYTLIRASGTLKDGREVGYWVRATVCCQRSDHRWLIAHEHISLPVDFKSGRALMDLVPDVT